MSAQTETERAAEINRRSEAHDEFYGNRDIEYEQWLDGLDSDRLFQKEEMVMRRLELSCNCGAHFCDGNHREGM
jgi:hypothetical protein